MKKIKTLLMALALVAVLVSAVPSAVNAAPYSVKYSACPRCHQMNASYGYDESIRWQTVEVANGKHCGSCNSTVTQLAHTYEYSLDRYYFLCNSRTCSRLSATQRRYSRDYSNNPTNHRIVNN